MAEKKDMLVRIAFAAAMVTAPAAAQEASCAAGAREALERQDDEAALALLLPCAAGDVAAQYEIALIYVRQAEFDTALQWLAGPAGQGYADARDLVATLAE